MKFTKIQILNAALLVLAWCGVTSVASSASTSHNLTELLQDLPEAAVPSGILYDRVLPLSQPERFSGSPESAPVSLSTWRQLVHEIRLASTAGEPLPTPESILAMAGESIAARIIPIALLDYQYNRLDADNLSQSELVVVGGRLQIDEERPCTTEHLFAATSLQEQTYHGSHVQFRLTNDFYFTNGSFRADKIEIDFDDGNGWRVVDWENDCHIEYGTTGPKNVRLKMFDMDHSSQHPVVRESRFTFHVKALRTPAPSYVMPITAAISYLGSVATGEAYVYLSDQNSVLTNPVIIIEGLDLDNSYGWDELYELLNQEELLETLRVDGFDAVVLNFTDATDHIQRNAFVAIELLQQVQAAVDPNQTVALAGASMGGLVGRYSLSYMEANAMEHRVRTFISFDSPQTGADIPLGLQYWVWFFASESDDATLLLAALNSPAARQLLLYHYTDPPGVTGESDPLRGVLHDELTNLGEYPQLPRRVAVANGSAMQTGQGFSAGTQIIVWEYTSFLVDVTGNVWAVPDITNQTIFYGLIDIVLLPEDEVSVSAHSTRPLDNAPGGWRGTMAQMDTTEAPYGDIVALHSNHCFIPTVSALALETDDLFYDIAGEPDLLQLTPFDVVYYPLENEEHVAITPQNVEWLIAEIEYGSGSDVIDNSNDVVITDLRVASANPANSDVRIEFALPAAEQLRLGIYSPEGREIAVLANREFEAGEWALNWNRKNTSGSPAEAGVYFVQLRSATRSLVRKLVLH
jgi:hypothetical protein